MLEAIKPLLDSGLLTEEAQNQIEKAFSARLDEARTEIASELRSEFANRYEHDKAVMVEALDKMVSETLTSEIEKINEEKNQLVADRAKFVAEMKNKSNKFEAFLGEQLKKEINEFVNDRKIQQDALVKMEKFIVRALAEELTEFAEDKKDLINTKVKLIAEAKGRFDELQKQFIARGSKLVESAVTNTLKAELRQLKEDIKVARENNFGRKIFEVFASEFSATHLNENAELRKLKKEFANMASKLDEATRVADEKSKLVESKDREIAVIKHTIKREQKLNEMLKPLAAEKASVMSSLLENVSTDRLEDAFKKYLPAVMNGSSAKITNDRKIVNESVTTVTGNRAAKAQDLDTNENIVEIRRLAGLK